MTRAFINTNRVSFLNARSVDAQTVYCAVFGVDPETTSQDHIRSASTATGTDARKRWKFSVASQVERVDIIQNAIVEPMIDTGGFTTLDPVNTVLEAHVDRIRGLEELIPWEATRVAVGCVATYPMQDLTSANEIVRDLFPGLPIDAETEDLVFRRNQPRELDVNGEGIRCNLIATWQVAKSICVTISGQTPSVTGRYALRVETDCNTLQDREAPLGHELGASALMRLAGATADLIPEEVGR